MNVFFYGLFMDEEVLAAKGIIPTQIVQGSVAGCELRIGERATLVRKPDGRAYGVVMEVDVADVNLLYSDASVADYIAELVTVELADGDPVEATCYNLPAGEVTGRNDDYAKALLRVASNLGFPEPYLEQIRRS